MHLTEILSLLNRLLLFLIKTWIILGWFLEFLVPSTLRAVDGVTWSGQLCSPAPASVSSRAFLPDLPWSKALRSNWAIINLSLKSQITVKVEPAGELTGRWSVSCSRAPVNSSHIVLCSCPRGELLWSFGVVQFSGKNSRELVGNPLFTLLCHTKIGLCLGRDLEFSFIQTLFLNNEQVSRLQYLLNIYFSWS